jgi:GAF domain-containing protein
LDSSPHETFNSLYWDFCSASFSADSEQMFRAFLSIPFIGIFALHPFQPIASKCLGLFFQFPLLGFLLCIFPSEYPLPSSQVSFQFPLLGFLLCIFPSEYPLPSSQVSFQFPLLGFLLCIPVVIPDWERKALYLSIPFIGIFALHQRIRRRSKYYQVIRFQFPLLGFLLCIFPSEYPLPSSQVSFQFPLLGFLLCIYI